MNERIRKYNVMHWFCGMLGLALAGCSTADNESSAGNISAVNHVDGTAVNWFSVNGYRASGGGGEQCCIILPDKWRPGLKATIKWEVDPNSDVIPPPLGTDEFREFMDKHELNYQYYSTTVEVPEWQDNERCGLIVHFLPCQQVKVTTSCWGVGEPQYPIKEPRHMKEPAACTK